MELSLGIEHHFIDHEGETEVYLKRMEMPAGMTIGKHVHSFDHSSLLAKGRVSLIVDLEYPRIVEAPATILIAAGRAHAVLALEDSVWYCVHPTNESDPDKIDHVLVNS